MSFEDRLLQVERLERWCCKATAWQQLRVALPIGLFLGIGAGLTAGLAPYPTPDEACEIITGQMKIQPGGAPRQCLIRSEHDVPKIVVVIVGLRWELPWRPE